MEFSSSIGSFLSLTIAFSMILQMQTVLADISCEPGETNITVKSDINHCRRDLQVSCRAQDREVAKVELNAPPNNRIRERVCSGCCRVPQPCPPKPPVNWQKCPADDINKSFRLLGKTNCRRCQDECKIRCDEIGARVGDQICGNSLNINGVITGLICTCCCREKTPALTSPPTVNICKPEEIFVAFQLSRSGVCSDCRSECRRKCSGMGSSVEKQQCTEGSSSKECKCCCTDSPGDTTTTGDTTSPGDTTTTTGA